MSDRGAGTIAMLFDNAFRRDPRVAWHTSAV